MAETLGKVTQGQVDKASQVSAVGTGSVLLPLVLAQFVCSYAGTSTNVAINDIATGIGTTVSGVQTTITLFTLTMAATMIPGSKLTDIWGRKFCFTVGLGVYALGALIAAAASSIGILTLGYSFGEGLGTALLIPPVYILATVLFSGQARAKAFGAISAAAGIGSAAGPLIGGLITSATSWRINFVVQALSMGVVFLLGRRIVDPGVQGAKPSFDMLGAVLSAAGLFFIVVGILQASTYGWFTSSQDFAIGGTVILPQGSISPVWLFVLIGGASVVLVLPAHPVDREGRQGAVIAHKDVREPGVQPWPHHTKHPMARPPGPRFRGGRLPANGAGL